MIDDSQSEGVLECLDAAGRSVEGSSRWGVGVKSTSKRGLTEVSARSKTPLPLSRSEAAPSIESRQEDEYEHIAIYSQSKAHYFGTSCHDPPLPELPPSPSASTASGLASPAARDEDATGASPSSSSSSSR